MNKSFIARLLRVAFNVNELFNSSSILMFFTRVLFDVFNGCFLVQLIKVRLLEKTLLMEIILTLKATMNQVKAKKLCFGYFCRFVSRALTLRPRNTYICVFRALFGF